MWNVSRLQDLLDCTDPDLMFDADEYEEYEEYGGNYYDVEVFGNNLQQTWKNMENGAPLFWLAAVVGIEDGYIIDVACELVEEVFKHGENVGWEQGQCLEAVKAWKDAEQSLDGKPYPGWYWGGDSLFQILRFGTPFPPEENELTEVSYRLADLIRAQPSRLESADERASIWTLGGFAKCAADFGYQLIHTLTTFQKVYQKSQQQLYEDGRGWTLGKDAASQVANLIRQRILFADVLDAAQRTGIWSVSQ